MRYLTFILSLLSFIVAATLLVLSLGNCAPNAHAAIQGGASDRIETPEIRASVSLTNLHRVSTTPLEEGHSPAYVA